MHHVRAWLQKMRLRLAQLNLLGHGDDLLSEEVMLVWSGEKMSCFRVSKNVGRRSYAVI